MRLSSQQGTYDSYTPSMSSSRTLINGDLHRKSSNESIQSQEGSISNFTCYSPRAAIDKGQVDLSGQGHLSNQSSNAYSGQDPSISDYKSFHLFEKPTFRCRNQSLSTLCTLSELEFDRSSTTTSTQRQSVFSFEDEAGSSPPSTPCSPCAVAPTLITDASPSPSPVHADPPSPPSGDGDSQLLATVKVSTAITPTIQEHQKPLSNVNSHASVTAGPSSTVQQEFSSFILPPGQEMAASFVPAPSPYPSLSNTVNPTDLYPNPTEMAESFVPALPPRPSLANTANLTSHCPNPTEMATYLVPASPHHPFLANMGNPSVLYLNPTPPTYLVETVSPSQSGTVTAKGKKGKLGFMSDFINSNKRNTLAVKEIFNKGGGKISGALDKMGLALQDAIVPGSSRSPPIPGTPQAAFPGPSKSVDDSSIPTAHSSGGPQVVFLPRPPSPYPPAPTPPQPVQPNLDVLNPQQSRVSESVPQTAFIRIKIFDRVQDDLIVTRVHSRVTHEQLLDKVQQRLGRQVARLSYRETGDGEDYVLLQQDDDVLWWIGSTDKHVLYVD